jgi:hypothetical protein
VVGRQVRGAGGCRLSAKEDEVELEADRRQQRSETWWCRT